MPRQCATASLMARCAERRPMSGKRSAMARMHSMMATSTLTIRSGFFGFVVSASRLWKASSAARGVSCSAGHPSSARVRAFTPSSLSCQLSLPSCLRTDAGGAASLLPTSTEYAAALGSEGSVHASAPPPPPPLVPPPLGAPALLGADAPLGFGAAPDAPLAARFANGAGAEADVGAGAAGAAAVGAEAVPAVPAVPVVRSVLPASSRTRSAVLGGRLSSHVAAAGGSSAAATAASASTAAARASGDDASVTGKSIALRSPRALVVLAIPAHATHSLTKRTAHDWTDGLVLAAASFPLVASIASASGRQPARAIASSVAFTPSTTCVLRSPPRLKSEGASNLAWRAKSLPSGAASAPTARTATDTTPRFISRSSTFLSPWANAL